MEQTMIGKNLFQVQKTARYFTMGRLDRNTEEIWLVCHGYGQLAEYFIRKFEVINDGKTFVIAPEGLNKFYLNGFSGRVGATWMTKEERETDIRDYLGYLDKLFGHLTWKVDLNKVKVNILGFSQGVATVCRWAIHSRVNFEKLILWAGIFPPDLNKDFKFSIESLADKEVYIVYGNKDQFLKEEHYKEIETFKEIKPDLKTIMFEGKHELDSKTLMKIKNGELS